MFRTRYGDMPTGEQWSSAIKRQADKAIRDYYAQKAMEVAVQRGIENALRNIEDYLGETR